MRLSTWDTRKKQRKMLKNNESTLIRSYQIWEYRLNSWPPVTAFLPENSFRMRWDRTVSHTLLSSLALSPGFRSTIAWLSNFSVQNSNPGSFLKLMWILGPQRQLVLCGWAGMLPFSHRPRIFHKCPIWHLPQSCEVAKAQVIIQVWHI